MRDVFPLEAGKVNLVGGGDTQKERGVLLVIVYHLATAPQVCSVTISFHKRITEIVLALIVKDIEFSLDGNMCQS